MSETKALGQMDAGICGIAVEEQQDPLSSRQLEILRGIAAGMSNSQIGGQLFLAEDTVKTHVRKLYGALGAINRAHAVYLACQRGLLQLAVSGGHPDSAD